MKTALLFFFFATATWARPIVLLSYFDPFGGAKSNNSEKVALAVTDNLKASSDFEIHLCKLPTVYEKSYAVWEDCLKALPEIPVFALGLGEGSCGLKIEIMGRNLDNWGPDNEGNTRSNTPVVTGAEEVLGFNYPLGQMYCALPKSERRTIVVSNNAGNFVCNHLAYNVAYHYENLKFGFIHVPNHNCGSGSFVDFAVRNLSRMIPEGVKASEFERMPTTKKELKELRRSSTGCLKEFYQLTKGTDEKWFQKVSTRE